jgi:hypothetical protein
MVYINSQEIINGEANLKLKPVKFKLFKKSDKTNKVNATPKKVVIPKIPETQKENYGLSFPYSHIAVVKEEKNKLKKSVLSNGFGYASYLIIFKLRNICFSAPSKC